MSYSPVRVTPENSKNLGNEERGHLVKFYNTIYVGRVQKFALKYGTSNQDHVVCRFLLWVHKVTYRI